MFGDKFHIHFRARLQFPQSLRTLKYSFLNRDTTTGIDHYLRITYHNYISVLTDAVLCDAKTSLVHVRHQVGTSYRTEIFPTVRTGLILYEIVIIVVIIFIIIIIIIYRFLFRRFIFLIFNSRRRI